jgi:hypothetical protein
MQTFLNSTGVPLSVALYLANDTYDHIPNTISATGLIRPIRQSILSRRVSPELHKPDILTMAKSRIGTAIHDSIEKAWTHNPAKGLKALGYPQGVIDRIIVNPTPEQLKPDSIPVYMEQRAFREIDGVTVSGKFDFVAEGRVEDFKSTSVFTWMKGNKDEDYQLQGSIYRWLSPDIITQDHMAIQFLFTDWMPGRAKAEPGYPNRPVEQHLIPLLNLDDTEAYIRERIRLHKNFSSAQEEDLPRCNDKDLWRSEPTYKYYKNPEKRARSTKNFDTLAEANQRKAEDGNVGVVVTVPGQVVACRYCNGFLLCSQKNEFLADGSLQM